MSKYKLEYIWLDGYEPVANLRSKTKIVEFDGDAEARGAPVWGFDGSSTQQAEGKSSDCVLKPVAALPRPARANGAARHVRGAAARRDAAPVEHPRDDPGRPGHLVRLRAGVLPLQGRRAARVPARGLSRRRRASTTPASATRTSATSRARSSTSTSTSASTPASTSRASTPRWRRASGSSRSSARARSAPPTRSGSPATSCCGSASATASTSTAIQAARRRADWNGSGMHTNFSTRVHARGRRQGVLRGADGRVRRSTRTSTSPSTGRTTTCA